MTKRKFGAAGRERGKRNSFTIVQLIVVRSKNSAGI
jgi:hypothetical protein